MSIEERLQKLYDLGWTYESTYGNCAQCTLAALMDVFEEIVEPNVFRAATALSGGTAGMGTGNCGAYSAGVLALGLMYGRERQDFHHREKVNYVAELARKLYSLFIKEYGGTSCHDVQCKVFGRTFNFQDPDDQKVFEVAGGHRDKCPRVVAKAAQWTGSILFEACEQ